MFYFFIKIIISLFIIITVFSIFNKKEITILEIIILLFIFNINIINLYNNISIIYIIIMSFLIIAIYYFYIFLYTTNLNKNINNKKILINRGIINFNELIKENYSYESLLYDIKKNGYKNPLEIDYCIKDNNNLIIFKKDTVKNYPISIIIDGSILKDNLFSINKTLEWLNNKINENNLCLKNINYAYYKNKELYFITN